MLIKDSKSIIITSQFKIYKENRVMKTTTKLLSVIACASMVLSMSACALFGGNQLSPSNLLSYAENSEAEVYDSSKKFITFLEKVGSDETAKKLKNGAVMHLEDKDIKKVLSDSHVCIFPIVDNFYDKNITEATLYVFGKSTNGKGHCEYIFSFAFEDEKDAKKYFKKIAEGYANPKQEVEADEGEQDDGTKYNVMLMKNDKGTGAIGLYMKDNIVFLAVSYAETGNKGVDALEEVLGDFDLHLVSDT